MAADFTLYTGVLKAWEQEDGRRYVSGTTSSTIVDLQGDQMTLSALDSMRKSALDNLTIYLNHDYTVPEDMFGSVRDARVVKRLDAETGEDVYDLDIDVEVVTEDENPRAGRTYRAIKRGVKLGLSIGATVTSAHRESRKGGEPVYVIDGLRLLESSVVAIPANQRSYLKNAVKALRASEDIVTDDQREAHRLAVIAKNEAVAAVADEAAVTAAASAPIVGAVGPDAAVDAIVDHGPSTPATDDASEDAPVVVEAGAEPEVVSEVEPDAAAVEPESEKEMDPTSEAWTIGTTLGNLIALLREEEAEGDTAACAALRDAIDALGRYVAREAVENEGAEGAVMALDTEPDITAEVADEAADADIDKALDAASLAVGKVTALASEVTTLRAEKAQVEAELSRLADLLDRALALPVGRKTAVTVIAQDAAEAYPWLEPAVARRIAARATNQ